MISTGPLGNWSLTLRLAPGSSENNGLLSLLNVMTLFKSCGLSASLVYLHTLVPMVFGSDK